MARGLTYTLLPVAASHIAGAPLQMALIPVGLAMWPCYEAGWRMPIQWAKAGLRQGPEVGEALFGAVLGAAFWSVAW